MELTQRPGNAKADKLRRALYLLSLRHFDVFSRFSPLFVLLTASLPRCSISRRFWAWRDSLYPGRRIAYESGGEGPGSPSLQMDDDVALEMDIPFALSKTDILALLLFPCGLAAAAVGVGVETRHDWLRSAWISVLLGPPAAWLRWQLSRLNGAPQEEGWRWFPYGTFIVNVVATAIATGMGAIQLRVQLAYWPAIVVEAVIDGFCGTLSTISTFMAEVRKTRSLPGCHNERC